MHFEDRSRFIRVYSNAVPDSLESVTNESMLESAEMIKTNNKSQPQRSLIRKLVFAAIAATVGLFLLEGMASIGSIVFELTALWKDGQRVGELKEERHCQYDEELGWINIPNTRIEDFYGPDRTITINADGVRGLENYSDSPQRDGQMRLVCLGDSFTLGYGVGDQDTFPQQLESRLSDTLQVVNMGQGGYSAGQCYLWLTRLIDQLEPDAVTCVLITEDFRRLSVTRTANGYSTPQFVAVGDRLQVLNTPVPPKLNQGRLLLQPGQISSVLRKHSSLVRAAASIVPSTNTQNDQGALETGMVIIQTMNRLCTDRGIPFAMVLTPTLPELFDPSSILHYQNSSGTLSSFCDRLQIPFKDLRPRFLNVAASSGNLFLEEAFHHYSADGNGIVAESLAEWLPEVIPDFPRTANPKN